MAAPHADIQADSTALIFEGGGMRASYTAAVVTQLVEHGIHFPKTYGISAGSSHAACYVAACPERARATFVDSVRFRRSGGLGELLRGQGAMNLSYVFEGLSEMNAGSGDAWDFDMEHFRKNPTELHIEAFDIDTGDTVAWEKPDMHTLTDVMQRVAASCAYPLFTSQVCIDGHTYVDGGMGTSAGICIDQALSDGFERFFVVLTRPRGFRMPKLSSVKRALYKQTYRSHPLVYQALVNRPAHYNRVLDHLDALERAGKAYVFCPTTMPVTYKTFDHDALAHAYELGRAQCEAEFPRWMEWFGA